MAEAFGAYLGGTLFTGTLRVLSPLHLGAGFDEAVAEEGDGKTAQIVLGVGDKPVITATALKGAMRALLDAATANLVFGERPGRDGAGGTAGCLTPYAALITKPAPIAGRVEPNRMKNPSRGTYRAVRTAIDPAFGVPQDHLLINAEMVGLGAEFAFRLRLMDEPGRITSAQRLAVAGLLRCLRQDGLRLGRGRGDGQGRVILSALSDVACWRVENGQVERWSALPTWEGTISDATPFAPGAIARRRLLLTSEVPFTIQASDDEAPANAEQRSNKSLRDGEGVPELPGSSLMGALRARADWLHRLRLLRGEATVDDDLILAELFGLTATQQRDTAFVGRLGKRIGRATAEITGFAGVLVVDDIAVAGHRQVEMTAVKLDRFTQSPMDGALFTTQGFMTEGITVRLRLRALAPEGADDAFLARHKVGVRTEALIRWLDVLLDDIRADGPRQGLRLGHGGNRGFGWFHLAEVTDDP